MQAEQPTDLAVFSDDLEVLTERLPSLDLEQLANLVRVAQALEKRSYAVAGLVLTEVKHRLRHGQWLPWLEQAGLNDRTARRYMEAARRTGRPDSVSDLPGVPPPRRSHRVLPATDAEPAVVEPEPAVLSEPRAVLPAASNGIELIRRLRHYCNPKARPPALLARAMMADAMLLEDVSVLSGYFREACGLAGVE